MDECSFNIINFRNLDKSPSAILPEIIGCGQQGFFI